MPVILLSTTPEEEKDEWCTEPSLFQLCNLEFNFNLDVAATNENALCKHYYTQEDNALKQDWYRPVQSQGGVAYTFITNIWCNPPFSLKHEFLKKGIEEHKRGANCCFLVPADAPESDWWVKTVYGHDYPSGPGLYQPRLHVRILKPRVNYYTPDKLQKKGNNRPSALIVMGWDKPQGIYTWYWKKEAIRLGLITDITPVADKLAKKNGIDSSKIKGSGVDGKIVVGDIKDLVGIPNLILHK